MYKVKVKTDKDEEKRNSRKNDFLSIFKNLKRKIVDKFAMFYKKIIALSNTKYANIIFAILFLIGLYLVIYPFVPAVLYKFLYEGKNYDLSHFVSVNQNGDGETPELNGNRIIIPKIGVDMPIVEGESAKALDLGVWHRPNTGSPGNGNMVLTGHRVGYAFLPQDIKASTSFYNLDKLEDGDEVYVFWYGEQYEYKITDHEVVEPSAVGIEARTEEERLTMYTCHPLGSNSKRLVYYAEPVKNQAMN